MIRRWLRERRSRRRDQEAARRAVRLADARLSAARQEWPSVKRAHDQLAEWIDAALRGRA